MFNDTLHIFWGDATGAFKFPLGTPMMWAGAKVIVVVFIPLVIAAAVAGVELLNPVRGIKLRAGRSKARNHYHRHIAPPGQPGQTAGKTYKELGPGY